MNRDLLQKLGKKLNLDLKFDKHEQCFISINDSLLISIRSFIDHIVFYGMVAELTPSEVEEYNSTIYSFNLIFAEHGKATLAIDESNDTLLLIHALPSHHLSFTQFEKSLADFITQLEKVIAEFEKFSHIETEQGSIQQEAKNRLVNSPSKNNTTYENKDFQWKII